MTNKSSKSGPGFAKDGHVPLQKGYVPIKEGYAPTKPAGGHQPANQQQTFVPKAPPQKP